MILVCHLWRSGFLLEWNHCRRILQAQFSLCQLLMLCICLCEKVVQSLFWSRWARRAAFMPLKEGMVFIILYLFIVPWLQYYRHDALGDWSHENNKKIKVHVNFLFTCNSVAILPNWMAKQKFARASICMSSDILAQLTTWRKTNMDPNLSWSYYFLPFNILFVQLLLFPPTCSLSLSFNPFFIPSYHFLVCPLCQIFIWRQNNNEVLCTMYSRNVRQTEY